MKPATAAKKLGILLQAAPEDFQASTVSRSELAALQDSPPEWLETLRREGPHPRQVVAAKLGVSTSGLARAGVVEALTSAEIKALLEQKPEWLVAERATQARVRDEKAELSNRAREARAER
ncbi:DUF5997 family protein [Homoserinibacter sp. YIM 151385]|uniref:DUF5997 family protein n=1 Tax=Homoserinibacter sp. YIM 151385 TaxID=2985506 RepID=UPI0022F04AF1|nr:DUF5997 family protein [Homoserinibacter sp. YIM 151385]WBU39330.1 DUF5997 family protein [Homoserinibacter sp. YIM 151385]